MKSSAQTLYSILSLLLIVAFLFGLLVGAYELSLGQIWASLIAEEGGSDRYVLMQIRLPRLLMSSLVGAGLALVGAALQGMFRNPLADSGLIGISGGAMLFAALGIVALPAVLPEGAPASLVNMLIAGSAFVGGLLTTIMVYRLGVRNGRVQVGLMLLSGIALASFAAALTGYLIYRSNDAQLRDLTFWTLGSLSGANWMHVALLGPALILSLFILLRDARTLNAMGLGEKEARLLGLDVEGCKRRVVMTSALVVGIAIAFTGLIGFVGLIVPHMLRLVAGSDFRQLLPSSALLGAGFLTLVDTMARTLVAPAELPIGILTALLGAPFFIWLLMRQRTSIPL